MDAFKKYLTENGNAENVTMDQKIQVTSVIWEYLVRFSFLYIVSSIDGANTHETDPCFLLI
jgi:hypothetical protein